MKTNGRFVDNFQIILLGATIFQGRCREDQKVKANYPLRVN